MSGPSETDRVKARAALREAADGNPYLLSDNEMRVEAIAEALAAEREKTREAIGQYVDNLADNYDKSPHTETDWRTVAHSLRSLAERIRQAES